MAHALQIDTLAFSKRLKEAGADDGLAEAIVEGITAADTSELATQADLAKVEHSLKADIAKSEAALKEDIAAVRTELKEDIAAVRIELKEDIGGLSTLIQNILVEQKQGQVNQFRWMIGMTVALLVGVLGAAVVS